MSFNYLPLTAEEWESLLYEEPKMSVYEFSRFLTHHTYLELERIPPSKIAPMSYEMATYQKRILDMMAYIISAIEQREIEPIEMHHKFEHFRAKRALFLQKYKSLSKNVAEGDFTSILLRNIERLIAKANSLYDEAIDSNYAYASIEPFKLAKWLCLTAKGNEFLPPSLDAFYAQAVVKKRRGRRVATEKIEATRKACLELFEQMEKDTYLKQVNITEEKVSEKLKEILKEKYHGKEFLKQWQNRPNSLRLAGRPKEE